MSRNSKSVLIEMFVIFLFSGILGIGPVSAAEPCHGDINCDSSVDGFDLVLMAEEYGNTGCGTKASRMVGEIIMWSGQMDLTGNHPMIEGEPVTQWHICNGYQETPDLGGRFIKAGGPGEISDTGGSSTVLLSEANLPEHSHGVEGETSCVSHAHSLPLMLKKYGTATLPNRNVIDEDIGASVDTSPESIVSPSSNKCDTPSPGHNHSIDLESTSVGGGEGLEITPPYYSLVFLMYTGE
ncbi:MAG: hypothetical protein GY699_06965 [Desulfobacteraceae bacterium]|nr:hypothetical protein [Desulfobacteraceae bacterium]